MKIEGHELFFSCEQFFFATPPGFSQQFPFFCLFKTERLELCVMAKSCTAHRAVAALLLLLATCFCCCNCTSDSSSLSSESGVKTAAEFINAINEALGKEGEVVELGADIDFKETTLPFPLGVDDSGACTAFNGTLQGNGHVITNLTMKASGGVYKDAGLFCALEGATVEDLVIDASCTFTGVRAGALSVAVTGATTVTKTVNRAPVSGQSVAGGLVGVVSGTSADEHVLMLTGCVNKGTVTASDGTAGGLVGTGTAALALGDCVNEGEITGQGDVGGLMGNTTGTLEISLCTNLGNVSGGRHAGGLVGRTEAAFTNVAASANRGNVTATGGGSDVRACGLFCTGSSSATPTPTVNVSNCASLGNVDATKGSAYGVADTVTSADLIVLTGTVTGKEGGSFPFWDAAGSTADLYALTSNCPECDKESVTLFEYNETTGLYYYINDTLVQLDTHLSKTAKDKDYGGNWTYTLLVGMALSVSVGKPVSAEITLSSQVPVQELRALYTATIPNAHPYIVNNNNKDRPLHDDSTVENDSVIKFCHRVNFTTPNETMTVYAEHNVSLDQSRIGDFTVGYLLLNRSTRWFIDFSSPCTSDMELTLGHQVIAQGATSMSFFLVSGEKLEKDAGLLYYFEKGRYYRVTLDDGTPVDENYTVKSSITLNITDLCLDFSQPDCVNTSDTCIWVKGNETCVRNTNSRKGTTDTTLVIALAAVGAAVLVAAAVIVLVLVLRGGRSNRKVEVALAGTNFFQTGAGSTNTHVTVSINGTDTLLQLVRELGRGSFATVWLAHGTGGNEDREYAVKVVNGVFSRGAEDAQKEASMMEHLDPQFVVAVYGCGYTDRAMAIAMEYFALGSLQKVLQQDQLPPNARVPILLNIAKAMAYLHANGIIHRDLKPGNVLVCSLDPQVHPMCKFVSDFFFYTWFHTHASQHNSTQDIGLWRSTFSAVDGTEHDHDKRCGHAVLHGTRDGQEQQALHCCSRRVQLWHHGCPGHGWSSQLRTWRRV